MEKELPKGKSLFEELPKGKSLFAALLECKNEDEMGKFIRDVLSDDEIKLAEERWKIAQVFLETGCSQNQMNRKYGVSKDRAHRVHKDISLATAKNLGYRLVYERLNKADPKKN